MTTRSSRSRRILTAFLFGLGAAAAAWLIRGTPDSSPRASSFAECEAAGNPVRETYPRQCVVDGTTFVEDLPGTVSDDGAVRLDRPRPGEVVGTEIVLAGSAAAFENTVNWRVRDGRGTVLAEGFATADAPLPGEHGPFALSLPYRDAGTDSGTVEAFVISARDGSEQSLARVPVTFDREGSLAVEAFFGNTVRDPETLECQTAYPVIRRVPRDGAPARAALGELLRGPTEAERSRGVVTSLPEGTRLLGLSIADGTATARFSAELSTAASGSCRVGQVRAQVESTLLQFPTVSRVLVSIEGDPDGLEP